MYEIQLFGRLEVRTRGVRLTGQDFGGEKPRQILALLALRGETNGAELAELLWSGRPPAGHRTTVEGYVSLLRHRLDPAGDSRDSAITSRDGGYALVDERVRVDVARFDELVAAASGRTAGRALRPLTAAAHLAGRPLLEDVEHPEWAAEARERYRTRLVTTLLDAGGLALAAGEPSTALELAGRAVDIDPVAERGWAITMAAHRSLGDRVAALRAYDLCRRRLAEDLGVEPSAETRALFLELLRYDGSDPAVDGAVAAILAAAGEAHRPGTVADLLRRAAELAARPQ
ncbi:BTAD domain-containing putative transcriptional regulator [Amorphoplanes digitatis]|uniref:DNA-binding SARP family transcriptional activator n=1 Tax=Actinoplanes digitatis TaxID=1868 RepID=A0A7W7I430_9ACTN|nr:BTAD domain-containing putative transcriptional regulator [Actinoplanes digitatis]MBB4766060.1 DNA-binding SARP family transcriptional activator [Actinoplanes digitatis]